jgi:hypothetical protein
MRKRPWINSKSEYKRFLQEGLAMRTMYEDENLFLLYHRGAYTPNMMQKALGFQRMSMLHEIWTYNPMTKRFQAFKNKGLGSGLVELMSRSGIKLKSTAARISDAAAMELRFATEQDEFLFKLKYGKS